MSIEAFWSVNFISTQGSFGAGVVVFETGKIYGGDSGYYYRGSYQTGQQLKAEITVKRYTVGWVSVFGDLEELVLVLESHEGDFNGKQFSVRGHVKDAASNKIHIVLNRIEDLS